MSLVIYRSTLGLGLDIWHALATTKMLGTYFPNVVWVLSNWGCELHLALTQNGMCFRNYVFKKEQSLNAGPFGRNR